MKLISAEALKAKVREKYKALPDRCEINELINDAPTVDAIPVEWIREYIANSLAIGIYPSECVFVAEMLMRWDKEQEARE